MRIKRLAVAAGSIIIVLAGIGTFAQISKSPQLKADVAYANIGGKPLLMDVYRSDISPSRPQPLVVLVHGGGWCSGNRKQMADMAVGLARLGYCAVTVEYRLAPQVHFPEPLSDVKTAIIYLKSHAAEFNIDPSRIGIVGGSAGGHLALLVAVTNSEVNSLSASSKANLSLAKAVVSIAGPTDLTQKFSAPATDVVKGLMGRDFSTNAQAYAEASPVHWVNSNSAHLLLIHGDQDEIVPFGQAKEMLERSRAAGAQVALVVLRGGHHSGGASEQDNQSSVKQIVEFLAKNLQ